MALLAFAIIITTILFGIINYQNFLREDAVKSKDIDTAISLFQRNLSEKISIMASSNIFMDLLSSGKSTRSAMESKFLIELLPLRPSGIIGYSLINSETGSEYQHGKLF